MLEALAGMFAIVSMALLAGSAYATYRYWRGSVSSDRHRWLVFQIWSFGLALIALGLTTVALTLSKLGPFGILLGSVLAIAGVIRIASVRTFSEGR